MKFQIKDLRCLQEELDARIFTLHHVNRTSTRDDRCLALLVEISELANETRCFKYWSLRAPSAKEVLLEELEDSIHFLLSLGIDLEDDSEFIESLNSDAKLNELFLGWYASAVKLHQEFTLENYRACFGMAVLIGQKLDFTNDELRAFYLLKNQKNHQRQDTNY